MEQLGIVLKIVVVVVILAAVGALMWKIKPKR
jgi:hypothetical protein